MTIFRQVIAVAAINLGSLPQRLGASLVVIAGIAGVVGVLVSVLALGRGLEQTFATTGRPDRAIVTAKGALSESSSSLQRDVVFAVQDAPSLVKDTAGKPIYSTELLTQVRSRELSDGVVKNISLRGIGSQGMVLRKEINIAQGRMFRAGLHEVIVGIPLQAQFQHMNVGDSLVIQNSNWTIVGGFATVGGSAHDSEVIGDAASLLSTFHRSNFQSITVQLTDPAALTMFAAALVSNPSLSVEVHREDRYFADQVKAITKLLNTVGYTVGGIMAIGAVFAALNTMYAAVSAQSLVIATLRGIGFNAVAILVAVFVEVLALAVIGAATGTAVSWLLFNGHTLDMLSGAGNQAVFTLHISPQLAVLGSIWALIIAFIGGLFPAVRAARLPVAAALRAT